MLFIILETFIFLKLVIWPINNGRIVSPSFQSLFVAVIVDNLAGARELAKKDATISKVST